MVARPWSPSPEDREDLSRRINRLIRWACDHLPEGWRITLTMTGEDGSLEIENHSGKKSVVNFHCDETVRVEEV